LYCRGVGFVKINAHCTLVEGDAENPNKLKGICFLKGDTVTVLVALHCEDGTVHSLLVEQPRYVLHYFGLCLDSCQVVLLMEDIKSLAHP